MRSAAIIAAAGIGRRMGGDRPKQYLELEGRPIICHTLDRFREARGVEAVVVVVEPERVQSFRTEILEKHGYPNAWKVVAGGALRQESVANGLAATPESCEVVLVHDGVRPFVDAALIEQAAATALTEGACIVAAPVRETIKRVGEGLIVETVDRSVLWGAQTPQAFRRELLCEAMEAAIGDGFVGTDEASIVERLGRKVAIVEGDSRNIKITTPEDLIIATAILGGFKE